ncbi:hypothetical protein L1987_67211 [Smallanthus sonchifolius]|uniref:Uncharacterized protein n=1 Tax=Smallanthus sonchifolius TaxID=185202 RepID=A0ACB9BZA9_9ASTR|nr:hypothetical protein L1987_67211 [Smallanthus sonchifolius]
MVAFPKFDGRKPVRRLKLRRRSWRLGMRKMGSGKEPSSELLKRIKCLKFNKLPRLSGILPPSAHGDGVIGDESFLRKKIIRVLIFLHTNKAKRLLIHHLPPVTVSMNLNDLNKVWEIKPLKMGREKEARQILEKVAKQVQPIMRNRKWKVNILSEFWPSNPALLGLNVNGGQEVKLRLRTQYNELEFFPYHQILDTMLHELCHNQYGPHNADFYNLLDEIRKECEELMAKGITGTGQGFDLRGKRLGGGGFTRQPPLSSLRQKALAAAETRVQRGALLPSGPKRLGGDSGLRDVLTPIQAAAMAAERRLHDDLWCSSQTQVDKPSDTQKVITSGEATSASNHEKEESWQCGACTLLNGVNLLCAPSSVTCEACETQRIDLKNTNTTRMKMWSCKFCTLQNPVARERCLACGEWKYSYGPPTATRGPYLGT